MVKAKRVVFTGKEKVEIVEFEIERVGEDALLIETEASLVSAGTELAALTDGYLKRRATYPRNPGYAACGKVLEAGGGELPASPGDRVFIGGNHATHALATPEWGLHSVFRPQEELSAEEVCFAALGGVAMHGVRRVKVELGEGTCVFGLGLVGQLVVQIAKLWGAHPLIAVEPNPFRREIAKDHGADHALDPNSKGLVDEIREITDGGADVLFETSGTTHTIPPMLKSSRYGARLSVTGGVHGIVEMDFYTDFQTKELAIYGARRVDRRPEDNPHDRWVVSRERNEFLALVAEKRIDVSALVTHRVHYSEAPKIYRKLVERSGEILGVVFTYE